MVWAESLQAAHSLASEVERWEDPSSEAVEADGRRADGWGPGTVVYHDGEEDLTVAECEERMASEPQPDTHTIDMFAEQQAG